MTRGHGYNIVACVLWGCWSFDYHVNLVCQACNYHMWSLRHIQKFLTVDMANTIACSVVGSRLDYCNSILYKPTKANITKLQRVQSNLLAYRYTRRTHADDLLAQLHWLPVSHRIEYKIALVPCKALEFGQPRYLADLLIHQQQVHASRSESQYLNTSRCQTFKSHPGVFVMPLHQGRKTSRRPSTSVTPSYMCVCLCEGTVADMMQNNHWHWTNISKVNEYKTKIVSATKLTSMRKKQAVTLPDQILLLTCRSACVKGLQ